MPKLSIIITVYNVVTYLADAVESVLTQSYKDFELLLVDDGSSDGSYDLCLKYAAKDERIRCFYKENGGAASARNFGIEQAQGELIGFVDADDWIEPDFYECLVYRMIEADADLSACGFVKIYDRQQLKTPAISHWDATEWEILTPEEAIAVTFRKDHMRYSPCNKIYRRALFDQVRYREGVHFEDKDTTYRLIHNSRNIVYSDQKKYHYFVRQGSVMRRPLDQRFFTLFEVNERLLKFLESHYPALVTIALESYKEECREALKRIEAEDIQGTVFSVEAEKCRRVLEVKSE